MFSNRLREYRNKLGLSKRDMAEKVEVSESYYNLMENDKRSPSRNFIEKLVFISELPEEYWIYGISKEDYLSNRDSIKNTKRALEQIINIVDSADDIFKPEIFSDKFNKTSIEGLLISALKSDLSYLIEKRDKKEK